MAATMVKDWAEMESLLQYLQTQGYAVTDASQVTEGLYQAWMRTRGFSAIVNDSGEIIQWVKGTNIIEAAASYSAQTSGTGISVVGTTTTVVPTDVLVGDVVDASGNLIAENIANVAFENTTASTLGLSSTASGAVAGDTAAALTLTPKTVVVASVLTAMGFTAAYDVAQDIVDKMLYDDTQFEWGRDSVGGKILTYITGDKRTYISQDLIERLRQYLEDNHYMDTTIYDNTFNHQDWTLVPFFSLEEAAARACAQFKFSDYAQWVTDYGFTEQQFNSIVSNGYESIIRTIQNNHGGNAIGFVSAHLTTYTEIGRHYTMIWTVVSGDSPYVKGSATTTSVDFNVNSTRYRVDEYNLGIPAHEWRNGIFRVQGSLDDTGDESSIHFMPNVGVINENALPYKPNAVLPVSGTPLADTFPNWYNNRKYVDEDGEQPHDKDKSKAGVLPIQLPFRNPEDLDQDDAQNGINTDDDLDNHIKNQDELKNQVDIPTPDPTDPIDPTPAIVTPTSGSNTGLVKIYNPTLTSLANFSQWLWSSNVFDNFSKLFQDPMQAIIGLNLLYATPTRGVDENIIVGNLDSGVTSRTVSDQYINIDCGTMNISRYFENALDYINTKVECYLPFVGIVRLNAADLIGKAVNITATVDVLTGSILYNIKVDNQILYMYNGMGAVQLPLSSANYSGIFSTLASIAGSAISGFSLGGAIGAIGGAASAGITSVAGGGLSHQVEKSGSVGSNAGAMGVKKPYLIITRNKPYNPAAYNKFYGYPANSTAQRLGNLSGYTRIKDVRISGIHCTQAEKEEIEKLLKEGVIL